METPYEYLLNSFVNGTHILGMKALVIKLETITPEPFFAFTARVLLIERSYEFDLFAIKKAPECPEGEGTYDVGIANGDNIVVSILPKYLTSKFLDFLQGKSKLDTHSYNAFKGVKVDKFSNDLFAV